ncbi:MAG: polysaccharide biosynthesis C-terminal domain-containing protein, partial [Candidatus Limnocylindrales bacterium]
GLALNIGANLVAIPLAGIAGAAIASSISYSVTAVLTLIVFRRISGRGFAETLIVRRGDVRLVVSSLRAVAARETLPRPPDG